MPKVNAANVSRIETDNARETFPYHEQSCLLSPGTAAKTALRRTRGPSYTWPTVRPPPFSSYRIPPKPLWGDRSTPRCSSLQRNGDRIMKRMGVFLSVVMLSLSLLAPSMTSAANTASGSTTTHQTTPKKKTQQHAKGTSHKHKASASSSRGNH